MGLERKTPTILQGDNIASEIWAASDVQRKLAKHLSIRYNYIREQVIEDRVLTVHGDSSMNVADGLTKPLSRLLFEAFRDKIGVHAIKYHDRQGVV